MVAPMNGGGEPGLEHHDGDTGRIRLGGRGVLPKTDLRVSAYVECDAANAAIGVAMAAAPLPRDVATMLVSVQNDLLDLVSDLGVPAVGAQPVQCRIVPAHVERLDRAVGYFAEQAGDLSGMVLPGGTVGAALLYQARAAVRRAEVAVWRAIEAHQDDVNRDIGRYLNHLSTLLFVIARGANAEMGDAAWVPEFSVRPAPEASDGEAAGGH
ncbi:ATP:cob(I)alamin adenosyltransferase [Georgenia yuyongxinii]|uniref:Corrinoid adenosyltransferase n=2 Tax=Georgenia yuyongxinii TaxID=2589797 RepID=A0A5B8C195_9MICO|nr:ATP:cob(I)alamin adenosyltransferase [Georgenia yuyongxinii]